MKTAMGRIGLAARVAEITKSGLHRICPECGSSEQSMDNHFVTHLVERNRPHSGAANKVDVQKIMLGLGVETKWMSQLGLVEIIRKRLHAGLDLVPQRLQPGVTRVSAETSSGAFSISGT